MFLVLRIVLVVATIFWLSPLQPGSKRRKVHGRGGNAVCGVGSEISR